MNPIAGQIHDLFEFEEIQSWVDTLSNVPAVKIMKNDCHGVDENNLYNFWFQKTIFDRVRSLFDQDLQLMFGMLLNETKPWGIHTDAYHCDSFPDREPAMSLLIPFSVDKKTDWVDRSHTIVFDQTSASNKGLLNLFEQDLSHSDRSAWSHYNTHLNHNNEDLVKKLSVQGIYQWKQGSLIYWNSYNLHDSDNFIANGYSSKQAIVIHTFLPK